MCHPLTQRDKHTRRNAQAKTPYRETKEGAGVTFFYKHTVSLTGLKKLCGAPLSKYLHIQNAKTRLTYHTNLC